MGIGYVGLCLCIKKRKKEHSYMPYPCIRQTVAGQDTALIHKY